MEAIKPILRYLASRKNDGLTYDNKVPLEMECYTDSDYAADTNTRRSVSGILVKVSGMVLFWASSRKATVTHSSTESEYIAADTGVICSTQSSDREWWSVPGKHCGLST